MKITTMVTMAVLAATGAQAGNEQSATPRVTLCMETVPDHEWKVAKQIVSKVFTDINVRIEWRLCPVEPISEDAIRISLVFRTTENYRPGVLGFSTPYEGVHLQIFYDRIQSSTERQNVPTLMAHVLIHEITHILQGIDRHSEVGMMKAGWNATDKYRMTLKALPFTETDVRLIHRGLETRAARLLAGASPQ